MWAEMVMTYLRWYHSFRFDMLRKTTKILGEDVWSLDWDVTQRLPNTKHKCHTFTANIHFFWEKYGFPYEITYNINSF
jgi:hypothetical protein